MRVRLPSSAPSPKALVTPRFGDLGADIDVSRYPVAVVGSMVAYRGNLDGQGAETSAVN